jgi:hypothetical protein
LQLHRLRDGGVACQRPFTIQDAVNQVSQTGGTVCLGPGQYALRAPVQLTNVRSVRIRGQGPATVIAASGAAFVLRNCVAVGIESLAILSLGQQPAISVQTVFGMVLRQLVLAVLNTADTRGSAIALQGLAAASIAENAVFATVGILANDPTAPRAEGDDQAPFLLAAALAVDDNIFWCRQRAIALDGSVLHLLNTRIAGNDALACAQVALSALGMGLPGASIAVCRNSFSIPGSGIRCAVGGAWIGENKLVNTASARTDVSTGIALATGLDKSGLAQCQILANQIDGFGLAGIVIGAPVRDLIVKPLNIIEIAATASCRPTTPMPAPCRSRTTTCATSTPPRGGGGDRGGHRRDARRIGDHCRQHDPRAGVRRCIVFCGPASAFGVERARIPATR